MIARARAAAVGLSVSVLLAACTGPEPSSAPAIGEFVAVEQGELHGVSNGPVLRYRGIPYAAPPIGERRWRPPQEPPPWSGTRPATEPGARCPQLAAPPGTPHATAAGDTEDCLTLDVTVPAGTPSDARLPVLVWFHGGGFAAGAGSDTDPRRLAEAGPLVVVTINYRLGILGFLGLPGLEGSGAFGLLDQQAALTWVRRNIAAFGGNPDSVTIAGQSAGADSVCAQLVSPGAVGLFHRAIMQSGGCSTGNLVDVIRPGAGPSGDTWKNLPLLESAGAAAASRFGCADPDPDPGSSPAPRTGGARPAEPGFDTAAVLDCLRDLPATRLVAATDYRWSPATGTPTVPRRPSDVLADQGMRRGIPVLAGSNRDEGALFTAAFYDRAGTPMTDSGFRAALSAATGAQPAEAAHAYRTAGSTPGRAWADVITDRAYACPGLVTYRRLADRVPVFTYEFADPSAPSPHIALPPDLAGGATHGAEMPYLFDLVPGRPELTPAQEALAAELVDRWARFAATGNPNGADGVTPWPEWTGDGQILTITGPGAGTTVRPAAAFATDHHCALWGRR